MLFLRRYNVYHASGNNITEKWMNVNKSNVRIFRSHIGGFDGYQNLIVIKIASNTAIIERCVCKCSISTDASGTAKNLIGESNGNKFLKWNPVMIK